MREITNNKKLKLMFIMLISFIALLIMISLPKSVFADTTNNDCVYLSDIEYDKENSKVGWGSITPDSNLETQYNHGLITLIVDGKPKYFLKGMSAHATSTLIYDISKYQYKYFSTYIGVDESRKDYGNGVKFKISTSANGKDWEDKTDDEIKNSVFKGNTEAKLVKIELGNAKFIKLEALENGNNSSDHSVYANAKLYNDGYVEPDSKPVEFIKTVEEYDNLLRAANLSTNMSEDTEKILLQRTFVNNVGYDLLLAIVNQNEDYRTAVSWMMNDLDNLRLYVLGGEPDGGSYYNSIKELARLYKEYHDDFLDDTPTNNIWVKGLTKGQVYKKMAISLSLTHATKVGYWAQIDHPSNRSDSVNRYAIYKQLYNDNKFIVAREVERNENGEIISIKPKLKEDGTPVQDHTPWFEALTVEEMRYVMNNITDDEELIWFNDYTQKRIDEHPGQEEKYLQPHTYIAYVWPNFENPIFHDLSLKDAWDKWFEGIFSKYHVTYSTETDHVYKAWMSMRNNIAEEETGAVCGGISKLGAHIRAAHGTPASVVGQPGHAAIIYYRKDANGNGYWTLDNDVSGWAQTGKSEKMNTRMPLGWGNDSYVSGFAGTYMMLSQAAINDEENYEKAEKLMMTIDLYKDNLDKQEQIYRDALKVQNINIDAWWGLINVYKQKGKSQEEFLNLAKELGENLKSYPLPMKNLLDQIGLELTDVYYSFNFTLLETRLLNEGKNYTNDNTDVMQPSITRTVANYLLGNMDTSLASFSFDGKDANKIVLASKYDGVGVRWEYSLDGKKTWKTVDFSADEEHKYTLSADEIAKITSENDICINIVGRARSDENIYVIDIEEQELPDNIYHNDLENSLFGIDLNTSWRYVDPDSGEFGEWTSYAVKSPDLTGYKLLQIRKEATGTKLASKESEIYVFLEDENIETKKYITISDMEIVSVNTESEDAARPFYAKNIIDGNKNTLWHSNFKYDLQKMEDKDQPEIIIKLNRPRYISAIDFIQKKYIPNDRDGISSMTVYVSEDNENWKEAGKIDNLTRENYSDMQTIEFDESILGQYVKLSMRSYDLFTSLAMINLYEDESKIDKTKPTAGIHYSTTIPTNDYVIARLVNPSTEITITNNDGNDTYVFKENGEFTFKFVDKEGHTGEETAVVTWIDEKTPTAEVQYKLDSEKKLSILLESISEDVYLLDNNNNKINFIEVDENSKPYKNSYLDNNGNIYKVEELKEVNGQVIVAKTTYTNTTGKIPDVAYYVVTLSEDGKTKTEEFLDKNEIPVEISEQDKESFRALEKVKTNPLEYTFENSGSYEFKLLDKASNYAYKSIKADYLEDSSIIASDIIYDIANTTNKDVTATINPYKIDDQGVNKNVEVINNDGMQYVFNKNDKFTFKYKASSDIDNDDVMEHEANVYWIDKDAPTAEIKYSINEETDGPVIATLENESEDIIITNNNMNREYVFNENGKFTFEFMDKAGNTGTAVAEVNWINNNQDDNPGDDPQDEDNTGDQDETGDNQQGEDNTGGQGEQQGGNNTGSQDGGGSNPQGGNSTGSQGQNGSNPQDGNSTGSQWQNGNNTQNGNINTSSKDDVKDENKYPNYLPKTGDNYIILHLIAGSISFLAIIICLKIKLLKEKNN